MDRMKIKAKSVLYVFDQRSALGSEGHDLMEGATTGPIMSPSLDSDFRFDAASRFALGLLPGR